MLELKTVGVLGGCTRGGWFTYNGVCCHSDVCMHLSMVIRRIRVRVTSRVRVRAKVFKARGRGAGGIHVPSQSSVRGQS